MGSLYIFAKHLHVWCVVISISLFVLRLIWLNKAPHMLQKKWVKIIPHINDTLLLGLGLTLALTLGINPADGGWLSVKLGFVALYIVLGICAFKIAKRRKLFATLALLSFAVILYLAINKPF